MLKEKEEREREREREKLIDECTQLKGVLTQNALEKVSPRKMNL